MRKLWSVAVLAMVSASAFAKDTRQKSVYYECDAEGQKLGLPRLSFPVKYVAGDGSSIAVVPVHHHWTTLTRVEAPTGAKYVASSLTWWEKGDSGTIVSKGAESGSCWVVTGLDPSTIPNYP
jgi:membrane-bound inhibitor of C-type lysozyme